LAKSKKGNLIKRVYERGQERTVSSSAKRKKLRSASGNYRPKKQPRLLKRKASSAVAKTSALPRRHRPQQISRLDQGIISHRAAIRPVVDTYEFPSTYNLTQIILMVKDPYWIYAYWDIAQSAIDSARSLMSNEEFRSATVVLRMYEVSLIDFNGHNANYTFDIDVGFHANNWYVNLWNDHCSFIADLGLRAANGKFVRLARSNCVQTPRQGYAPRSEQIWMKVDGRGHQKAYAVMRPRVKKPHRLQEISAGGGKGKRRIYLSEEDIRLYYSNLSPLLREIIATRLSKRLGRRSRGTSFIIEGESAWDRTLLLSGLSEIFFVKKILRGASEYIVLVGQNEQARSSFGASDYLHQKDRRQFFFELGAELIVYGRTETDATVRLGSKNITLRPDGTFSLRFALPDGNIPLEFTAESLNKQQKRKINTYVARTTNYPT